MNWLKPIQERLDILASTRSIPSDEDTTVVDMLEADVRKLALAVRLANTDARAAREDIEAGSERYAMAHLNSLIARLRSGEVE